MAHIRYKAICSILAGAIAAGCATNEPDDSEAISSELVSTHSGAVFTMTNAASGNEIVAFRRGRDGTLQPLTSYMTGGNGSGDSLGSQGALWIEGHWLYAVNAGSNELSVFRVRGESLELIDVVPTQGTRPISVTAHQDLVYVLHAGPGANGIMGFNRSPRGELTAIPGSARSLSQLDVGPAQIEFGQGGHSLVVTEKASNMIDVFSVSLRTGLAEHAMVFASEGETPFGFAITNNGHVVVSEAFGGAAGAGATSSYDLSASSLTPISPSVMSMEGAPCWVVLGRHMQFAYVSNTASGSISAYRVDRRGRLQLVGSNGRAADTGAGSKPADMAVSELREGDQFLYVLNGGTSEIGVFEINRDGTLSAVASMPGVPQGSVGLAAF